MSNINKMLEITSANQDLFIELDEKKAETISGGKQEVFTILNETKYNVAYRVDGKKKIHKPGQIWIWTAWLGGRIKFDRDGRKGVRAYKRYNLSDGRVYVFKDDKSTPGNPWDIDLYKRA